MTVSRGGGILSIERRGGLLAGLRMMMGTHILGMVVILLGVHDWGEKAAEGRQTSDLGSSLFDRGWLYTQPQLRIRAKQRRKHCFVNATRSMTRWIRRLYDCGDWSGAIKTAWRTSSNIVELRKRRYELRKKKIRHVQNPEEGRKGGS